MIRILHAADFHMDTPFDSLPSGAAAQRRQEQRALLEKLADIAAETQAQIVLLAGDLLDSAVSYHETQETLLRVFSSIQAKIFISPGNHDFYCAKSPYAFMRFPENVHIFTSPVIHGVDLPELNTRVYGAGFTSAACPSLLPGFRAKDDGAINLMVLHGNVGGEVYNPISETDIAASGLDYLALGHVHTYSGLRKAGNTHYAYAGCPEGRGFDETGVKGILTGTVSKGSADIAFTPLGGREYHILPVDLTGWEDPVAAVENALTGDHTRDIFRILFTGEFDGDFLPEALTEQLAPRFYSLSLRNNTHLRRDIWAQCGEDTLKGLFLRRMRDAFERAETEEARETVTLAVRYGLSALENGEECRL